MKVRILGAADVAGTRVVLPDGSDLQGVVAVRWTHSVGEPPRAEVDLLMAPLESAEVDARMIGPRGEVRRIEYADGTVDVFGPPPAQVGLREWRERRGLSQSAAAELIGIGRTTWIAYEAGRSSVPKTVWLALRAVPHG